VKTILILCLLTFQIFWYFGTSPAEEKTDENFASCRTCHTGVEAMDEDHDFSCVRCHLMPEHRRKVLHDHNRVVRHPSSPTKVNIFCGPCHRDDIRKLQSSRHWTLAGMINQTRFLWGAQPDPDPRYSAAPCSRLEKMPESPKTVRTPADLVDDLLRRRCFACHLGTSPPMANGMFRGLGCAACHVPYDNDGRHRGGDHTLKGKKGYPTAHKFCRPIPNRQCMHCHNGPYGGGDYTGKFQHDFHYSYRTPLANGYLPEKKYLMDHHGLSQDVHHQAGLFCVDCHDKKEVMGSMPVSGTGLSGVKIRCIHCHGIENSRGNDRGQSSSSHRFLLSGDGVRHCVPVRNITNPAHNIPGMEKVHCLGCHSAWGFMDYGPSFIRDDRRDLSRWAPWRMQSDESVATMFDNQGLFLGKPDHDGPGPWLMGWRFRRWEYLTLGKDEEGRIVPFHSRYQYRISYVDSNCRVILNNVIPQRGDGTGRGWAFMPYYSHTVQLRGRNCEACHGESLAAGIGLWGGEGPDLALTRPSPPVYPSMGLLTEKEKQTLIEKSPAYRKWRFKTLWRDYRDR